MFRCGCVCMHTWLHVLCVYLHLCETVFDSVCVCVCTDTHACFYLHPLKRIASCFHMRIQGWCYRTWRHIIYSMMKAWDALHHVSDQQVGGAVSLFTFDCQWYDCVTVFIVERTAWVVLACLAFCSNFYALDHRGIAQTRLLGRGREEGYSLACGWGL